MGREPPHGVGEGGREDDWLADEGGIDWSTGQQPYSDEPEWPQQPERAARPAGLVRAPVRDGSASEAVLRRRRALAIGAVAAAIVIAIIVAVVAANGGSGGGSATPPTTPVTPQTPVQTPTETPTTTKSTTASATVTVPEAGHLSAGDSGPAVETLQQALKQLGVYDAAVDGDFGQGTTDAVIAFQTAHNLTADGIVGRETADAINQALTQSVG
jgi:hypothetical protein